MAPLSVGAAGTRLTRLTAQAGAAALSRTRLTDVSVLAGPLPPDAATTRLTELAVVTGTGTSVPRTRLSALSVTVSKPVAAGITELTALSLVAGPAIQTRAALPCVFYLADDGSFRPLQLLTLDDFPWN